MNRTLRVISAGPGVTIQDQGRQGYLSFGLSRGGAADLCALAEGAALLGQSDELAAIEMAGFGGQFAADQDVVIALTGARMSASIDGARIAWNACHPLPKGARLSIGGVERGSFGYLHVAGGFDMPQILGAKSAHLTAGIGATLLAGAMLPIGHPPANVVPNMFLPDDPRFDGGRVRMVPSLQTDLFSKSDRDRFEATVFKRDTRGNRMGMRFLPPDAGFEAASGLSLLSEIIVPGDIQITGDGTPFVLLSECQTTGGYPRIGSVLPSDLPKVAQTPPGATIQFQFVALKEAVEIERRETQRRAALASQRQPLIRDPHSMSDLLSYQLISGAITGAD